MLERKSAMIFQRKHWQCNTLEDSPFEAPDASMLSTRSKKLVLLIESSGFATVCLAKGFPPAFLANGFVPVPVVRSA